MEQSGGDDGALSMAWAVEWGKGMDGDGARRVVALAENILEYEESDFSWQKGEKERLLLRVRVAGVDVGEGAADCSSFALAVVALFGERFTLRHVLDSDSKFLEQCVDIK